MWILDSNPLLTAFKNKYDHLQQSFSRFPLPLSDPSVPSLSFSSSLHPLILNQSCAIRQLHQLYREVFAMCVCAVGVERSRENLCMCSPDRVQSQVISCWLYIFSLWTKNNKWSSTVGTHAHTHSHTRANIHNTQQDILPLKVPVHSAVFLVTVIWFIRQRNIAWGCRIENISNVWLSIGRSRIINDINRSKLGSRARLHWVMRSGGWENRERENRQRGKKRLRQ